MMKKPKKSQQQNISIQSPCVRNCCLNNDDICLGCFRHLDEITSWQGSSDDRKMEILSQCQERQKLRGKNKH